MHLPWFTIGCMPFLRFAWILLCSGLLAACSLPPLQGRSVSVAIEASTAAHAPLGLLSSQLQQQAAPPAAHSGIYPLDDPTEAFNTRLQLLHNAQHSLDVQYYIWRKDHSGQRLLLALLQAADRGVRVRLLLDDAGTQGLDPMLQALEAHPNIEVRLFNPFVWRWPKVLSYLWDFQRLNRRMHNKSLTADNHISIVGGRNIGDEYFGTAQHNAHFADLDLLALGPVVQAISNDFDRYWASLSSYPLARIVRQPHSLSLQQLREQQAQQPITTTPTPLLNEKTLLWASAHLISDDPAKALGTATQQALIGPQLSQALGQPMHTVDLISPYFVPTTAGVQALTQLQQSGVRVRVLTNSLAATDVGIVHAGYARHRPALLQAGIALYELRGQGQSGLRRQRPLRQRLQQRWRLASSGASLHAKTFAVDGQRAFVGSLNFDPRSLLLNTEMGLVIESPALAQQISATFDEEVPWHAYQVELDGTGQLQWRSRLNQPRSRQDHTPPITEQLERQEPNSRWWQRWGIRLLQQLPIEPLL